VTYFQARFDFLTAVVCDGKENQIEQCAVP
jgi:hypothetical protein